MARLKYGAWAAAVVAMLSAGCQTTTANSTPVNAVLSAPSAKTLAKINDAVSKALGGRTVTLAENILTTDSQLVMDPKFVESRSVQRPDHFALMMAGKSCYLVHRESGAKLPLSRVKCRPL